MQTDTIITSAITGVLSTISSILICYLTLRNKASMSQTKMKKGDRVTLRSELRAEVTGLREKMEQMRNDMQTQIDSWREKYNTLFLENGRLNLELKAVKTQVQHIKDQYGDIIKSERVFDNMMGHDRAQ